MSGSGREGRVADSHGESNFMSLFFGFLLLPTSPTAPSSLPSHCSPIGTRLMHSCGIAVGKVQSQVKTVGSVGPQICLSGTVTTRNMHPGLIHAVTARCWIFNTSQEYLQKKVTRSFAIPFPSHTLPRLLGPVEALLTGSIIARHRRRDLLPSQRLHHPRRRPGSEGPAFTQGRPRQGIRRAHLLVWAADTVAQGVDRLVLHERLLESRALAFPLGADKQVDAAAEEGCHKEATENEAEDGGAVPVHACRREEREVGG
jgi:hypothetical protein